MIKTVKHENVEKLQRVDGGSKNPSFSLSLNFHTKVVSHVARMDWRYFNYGEWTFRDDSSRDKWSSQMKTNKTYLTLIIIYHILLLYPFRTIEFSPKL